MKFGINVVCKKISDPYFSLSAIVDVERVKSRGFIFRQTSRELPKFIIFWSLSQVSVNFHIFLNIYLRKLSVRTKITDKSCCLRCKKIPAKMQITDTSLSRVSNECKIHLCLVHFLRISRILTVGNARTYLLGELSRNSSSKRRARIENLAETDWQSCQRNCEFERTFLRAWCWEFRPFFGGQTPRDGLVSYIDFLHRSRN